MKKDGKYNNGQPVSVQSGGTLTYFFKNGDIKAKGGFDGAMQGEWIFNRASGELWQVGHFKDDKKHGEWIRYDRDGEVEYHAKFIDGEMDTKIV